MLFSFIILTYNSSPYLKGILDSLLEIVKDDVESGDSEIILLDNKSQDDTLKIAREYTDNIIVKESGVNLGYAKGVNMAAGFARGEFLVIVNPDAKVEEFHKEKITSAFSQDKKIAAVGLPIADFDGKPELSCGKFFNPFTFFLYSFGLEKFTNIRFAGRNEQVVDFISGGFIVFRKKYFQELGGYDEDYFMYVEDMDICKRIQKKGYLTMYLPFGLLKHKGQGSSSREFAIVNIYKGLVIFYKKHSSTIGLLYVRFLLRIKAVLVIFIGTLFGKKDTVGAYSKALQAIS